MLVVCWREGAILFGDGQLEWAVGGVERVVGELTAAAVADGNLLDEEVEGEIEEYGGEKDEDAEVKRAGEGGEDEEGDAGEDDDREAELLGEVFADEQIAGAAVGAFGEHGIILRKGD
jgi:hypothetical protein